MTTFDDTHTIVHPPQAGDIVSSATLRQYDLLQAFAGALESCSPDLAQKAECCRIASGLLELGDDTFSSILLESAVFAEVVGELIMDLEDELSAIASRYDLYFGASEGDGACFGFWSQEVE